MPNSNINSNFSAIQQVPFHIHNGLDAPQIPFASIRDYSVSNDGTMAADSATLLPTQQALVTYVATQITGLNFGIFGDGSDGVLTKSDGSTTTLTRDTFYSNVTLSASSNINTGGYRLFVSGILSISGNSTVQNNGGNGGNAVNASGAGVGSPGAAGAGTPTGTLNGSVNGASGGGGGVGGSFSTGSGGSNGTNGTGVTNSISVAQIGSSGNGGSGGNGTVGNGAGAGSGGTNGSWTTAMALPRTLNFAINNFDQGASFVTHTAGSSGGSGGGGGGGGGGGSPNNGGGGGSGGGSGAPGGIMAVFAHTIINSVTGGIQTLGGNGGKGGNGASVVGTNTGGGGGGGGGNGGPGGALIVVYSSLTQTGSGSFLVTGGNAGALGTGGTGTHQNGVNGTAGAPGATGIMWPIQIS